jgi:hypothetical protein
MTRTPAKAIAPDFNTIVKRLRFKPVSTFAWSESGSLQAYDSIPSFHDTSRPAAAFCNPFPQLLIPSFGSFLGCSSAAGIARILEVRQREKN